MNRIRGSVATALTVLAVLIVAWFLLRGLFRVVLGFATLALLVVVVVVLLGLASKVRGRDRL